MRPYLAEAKQRLLQGYQQLKRQHELGAGGREICNAMSNLWDGLICDNFRAALTEVLPDPNGQGRLARSCSLLALGGLGRQDVAPHSDVDLMLLYIPGVEGEIEQVASRLVQDCYDIGLKLALATRTVRDATTLAFTDPTILTSLTEMRLLAGSSSLLEKFRERFLRAVRKKTQWSLDFVEKARKQEQAQFGESVYLLSPNIKRSRGGLREIHTVRWMGFIRFGETSLNRLCEIKALSRFDFKNLFEAREFLLRLRNELHFHNGRAVDLLDRNEQLRIADAWHYPAGLEILPVQEFMRQYFRHSTAARYSSFQFINDVRGQFEHRSFFDTWVGRREEEHFLVTPRCVAVVKESLDLVKNDIEQVLRLMEISNRSKRFIEQNTWRTIRKAMLKQTQLVLSADAKKYFMRILDNPNRLANLLRRLHEMNVLEKIIPAFRHARWLLQFNQYHKYTVDEHTLIAVEKIADFQEDTTPVGQAYREVQRKDLLHLAVLLHDVGKGYTGDHSEVGAELAEQTADRLGLSSADTETVTFLVRQHLLMSTLAFRRDITDPQVIQQFASEVGSPNTLRMLFTLTCADMAAVAPGGFNEWRRSLVTELYFRTDSWFADQNQPQQKLERMEQFRSSLINLAPDDLQSWMATSVGRIARENLRGQTPENLAKNLVEVARLQPGQVAVHTRQLNDAGLIEVTLGKQQQRVSGAFYRLIGTFVRLGLGILAARIELLPNQLAWYSFVLNDRDFTGPVAESRFQQIRESAAQVVQQPVDELVRPRKVWGAKEPATEFSWQHAKVILDNETAEHANVVDVFSDDHPLLIYTVAKSLYQLNLDIRFAKIAAHLDQVVVVFYVTDAAGVKIDDPLRLDEIKRTLLESIRLLDAGEPGVNPS
jgi:[protein-PII] uridylyltransferase